AATLRHRGDIAAAELAAAVPPLEAPVSAWLSYYGQLNRWLAGAPARVTNEHAIADRTVMDAMRNAPIAVKGTTLQVFPKSFTALVHLAELDVQLDGLTRLYWSAQAADATAAERDTIEAIAAALARAGALLVWAWTSPGRGLPWPATESAGELPLSIRELTPDDFLAVHDAVALMHARLQSLAVLLDPIRREQGGQRPSWSGLFHAMGMEIGTPASELMEAQSLEAVLAMAQLQAARNAPAEAAH
ncbi:MAG: hypothetical protein H7099_06250, partial [Gemmatimonadaceae bacterium]|nr:hypothetical protein [Gemmatimonadaceae bacterium]